MALILKGKEVADALNQGSVASVQILKKKNINPTLALIRLGDNPDDLAYEASIVKKAQSMGIQIIKCELDRNVTQQDLETQINGFNQDQSVHGILIFRPLPSHLDEQAALNLIAPEKDMDGVSEISMEKYMQAISVGSDLVRQSRSWRFSSILTFPWPEKKQWCWAEVWSSESRSP